MFFESFKCFCIPKGRYSALERSSLLVRPGTTRNVQRKTFLNKVGKVYFRGLESTFRTGNYCMLIGLQRRLSEEQQAYSYSHGPDGCFQITELIPFRNLDWK